MFVEGLLAHAEGCGNFINRYLAVAIREEQLAGGVDDLFRVSAWFILGETIFTNLLVVSAAS